MLYIENPSHDPAFNLALEEYLVTHEGRFADQDMALLWQNDPVVVVGRNQNAHREIDRTYLDEHGIRVVRRLSGGGAVYHDSGNVNFTVIKRGAHALKNNFSFFTEPLVATLRELGVEATFSGRNDVLVEGAKFSGNAQYSYRDTLLHHGTILYNSDLSVLGKVLTPKPRMEDFSTRGVTSHQSRVANLATFLDMGLAEFCAVFAHNLVGASSTDFAPVQLTADELAEVCALSARKYATTEWTWGKSPQYSAVNQARFNAGNVMACIALEGDTVKRLDFYGDFFEANPIEEYEELFVGASSDEVARIIESHDISDYIHGFSNAEALKLVESLLS